jgi:hypothetical protein
LDSDAAKMLPTSDYSSSSFWKGTLPAYRENDVESEGASIGSLDSIESDEEDINSQNSQMVTSTSFADLNLQ